MRDPSMNSSQGWWPMSGGRDQHRFNTDKVDHWEVTPRQLAKRLEAGDDVVLIDVRERWENELTSLPGSRLIPLAELEFRVEEELDRDQEVVLYCHHGQRSLDAAMTLWGLGYERVSSLAGGIDRWAQDVDPGMKRY